MKMSLICLIFPTAEASLENVTYDATVSALQCGGGGGDRGMVGGHVLDDAFDLPSSRELQCGTWGCAATSQAGQRRDPLEKSVIKEMYSFIYLVIIDVIIYP